MPASRTYTVVLERNEDGGYTVTVPALHGCVTQGQTIAEALSRVQEAIACHLEGLLALGHVLPMDCQSIQLDVHALREAMVMKVTAHPSDEGEKVA